jgi:hypothetical protein
VRLGYEIGSGAEVLIPIRHMVVTGQTQESGKTTTLEALIERAGLRAITFVTKRGEGAFATARRIDPYFRERADWKFVASILEASRGEKLKFERAWIIRASKGARSLADVQRNVRKAMVKAKGMSADVYLTLDAYLDEVVPLIAEVKWAPTVNLYDGVNAMDLTALSVEMQHLVIRSTIEWVLENAEHTIVVVPEAWKFIPQGRGTPVKLAAESYIRQAAGLGNYLWLDSQDIGGVEKTILRSCPVWILGVQREANEIKRTLENIPATIAKPKAISIATLDVGEFFACWGKNAVKTYVQPDWMNMAQAQQVARGQLDVVTAVLLSPRPLPHPQHTEVIVNEREAQELREENERLRRRIEQLEKQDAPPSSNDKASESAPVSGRRSDRGNPGSTLGGGRQYSAAETFDNESLYQAIKKRLIDELPRDPAVLRIVTMKPELRVEVERQIVTADGRSLRGRIARLIADGFFGQSRTSANVLDELLRRGADRPSNIELGNEMKALTEMGFFTRDNKWYTLVPDMAVNVVER